MTKSKHGFTPIEIIAVTAILGLAAAITLPAIERSHERVGVVREAVDLNYLQAALEQFHNTWEKYPTGSNADLVTALSPYILFDEKFIKDGLFIDPWGVSYVYRCPGIIHPESYDLFSWGPDGSPPGEMVYGEGGAGFDIVVCGEPHSGVFGGIPSTGSVVPIGQGVSSPPSSGGTSGSDSGGGGIGGYGLSTIDSPIPWNLAATPNDGLVYLSWKAPTGNLLPDYFQVYRSWLPDSGYDLIATVACIPFRDKQGFFPDKTVVNDYTYYYRITAVWEAEKKESEFFLLCKSNSFGDDCLCPKDFFWFGNLSWIFIGS
ncbi:MAG: type II secretion system protein GspG [Candidatus Ratteibacteria bacterium]|nr:type II secretion system protein GspG [Candidatus Ratteibacteria bacterium]